MWFYIGAFIIGVVLFSLYARAGKMLRCIAFTAVTGLFALGLLWLCGRFFPVSLDFTPLTTLVSAVLGIPGVIAMLLLNLL